VNEPRLELETGALVAGHGIDCVERFRKRDAFYAVHGTR
jgi:hypothetical protein